MTYRLAAASTAEKNTRPCLTPVVFTCRASRQDARIATPCRRTLPAPITCVARLLARPACRWLGTERPQPAGARRQRDVATQRPLACATGASLDLRAGACGLPCYRRPHQRGTSGRPAPASHPETEVLQHGIPLLRPGRSSPISPSHGPADRQGAPGAPAAPEGRQAPAAAGAAGPLSPLCAARARLPTALPANLR